MTRACLKNLSKGLIALVFVVSAVGCGQKGLIDHVTVTPSEDLSDVKISMFFRNNVQLALAGNIVIDKYGYFYMDPWTPTHSFEMGFDLKTAIMTDPGYIGLTPTMILPNGAPTGLPYAVVQISGQHPISPDFDLFGYLDIAHQAWLGVAGMFTIGNNSDFPAGLTITQVFLRDKTGHPTLFASVLGPNYNPDGTVKRQAGISLFANVKALVTQANAGSTIVLKPERKVIVSGPAAMELPKRKTELFALERKLVEEANRAMLPKL